MAVLKLRGLKKRFSNKVMAVDGIDLEVRDGEFIVILGPSGAGKSTLLRLVAGLESPTEGEIWMDQRRLDALPPRDRDIAMVFQETALFPHLRVYENLGFGLQARGAKFIDVLRGVNEAALVMGLDGMLGRYPSELSGGQRRRVALGRAFLRHPKVFLLDEPLSNLDTPLRLTLRTELAGLHRKSGAGMIMVTHDQADALALADRVVVMKEGRIAQMGTPREVSEAPVDQFVANLLSPLPMVFFMARMEDHEDSRSIVLDEAMRWPPPASIPGSFGSVVLGLRPEAVVPTRADDRPKGEVVKVSWVGTTNLVTVRVGRRDVHCLAQPDETWKVGESVTPRIDYAKALWFDSGTGARLTV